MFVNVILNEFQHIVTKPLKHDGMENAKEGWENYMYHKAFPLFGMNVLEIEPIFRLLKPSYICSPRGIPPTLNCYVTNIRFFQQGGIFIFIT
jgi:hypothetical protein